MQLPEIPDVATPLTELGDLIATAPEPARSTLSASFQKLAETVAGFMLSVMQRDEMLRTELQRLVGHIRDQAGELAVDMAYIDFDLAATRRERDLLKRELGDDGPQE